MRSYGKGADVRSGRAGWLALAFAAVLGSQVFAAAAGSASTGSYALGKYTVLSGSGADCPKGFTCSGFRVSCPGVNKADEGFIAKRSPSGTPKGTIMFFSEKGGNAWETKRYPAALSLMTKDLTSLGYQSVQVRWESAWLASTGGEKAGPAKLGCRPATVIKWVHDHIYRPRAHGVGACGFCIMGESGGASQISYALAFYGLDRYVDGAIPVAGPPHAALAKGCSPDARGYTWPTYTADTMDHSYGFLEGNGPCAEQDQSWASRWEADGIDTGGNDYVHPETRVVFLLGTKDGTLAVNHGRDYADRLQNAGSPLVSVNWVDGMHHTPWDTSVGIAAVKAAIVDAPIPATVDEPSAEPSSSPKARPSRRSPTPLPSDSPLQTERKPSALGGRDDEGPASWELVALGAIAFGSLAYAFQMRRRLRDRGGPAEPPTSD